MSDGDGEVVLGCMRLADVERGRCGVDVSESEWAKSVHGDGRRVFSDFKPMVVGCIGIELSAECPMIVIMCK